MCDRVSERGHNLTWLRRVTLKGETGATNPSTLAKCPARDRSQNPALGNAIHSGELRSKTPFHAAPTPGVNFGGRVKQGVPRGGIL